MNKISIITVVYNDVSNIEKSIIDSLSQTYSPLEIIVVDGGSTDGTIEVLKKYSEKIKWTSERDKGIYDAMNKGAMLATGEWILYHNCGDFFYSKDSISKMFDTNVDDDVCILHGDCRFVGKLGYIDRRPMMINDNYNMRSMPVFHPSAFIRTSYQQTHLYDISYKSSADFDFFLKCIKSDAKFEYRPVVITNYSYGEGMSVSNWYTVYKENRRVLKNNHVKLQNGILTFFDIVNTYIHNLAKKILPNEYVEKKELINLKKEGWTLY